MYTKMSKCVLLQVRYFFGTNFHFCLITNVCTFFLKIEIWLTNMIMHDNAHWCPDFKNKKMTIFSWLPLLQLYRYTLVLHCFNHQGYRWPEIDLCLRSTLYLTGVAFQCHTAANCSLASNELRWIERLRPNKSNQTNKSTQKWWNI